MLHALYEVMVWATETSAKPTGLLEEFLYYFAQCYAHISVRKGQKDF